VKISWVSSLNVLFFGSFLAFVASIEMTFVSSSSVGELDKWLLDKLESTKSPNTIIKCLRIIRHISENGHVDFKKRLRVKSHAIRNFTSMKLLRWILLLWRCFSSFSRKYIHNVFIFPSVSPTDYRGSDDPIHGQSMINQVRREASDAMEAIFSLHENRGSMSVGFSSTSISSEEPVQSSTYAPVSSTSGGGALFASYSSEGHYGAGGKQYVGMASPFVDSNPGVFLIPEEIPIAIVVI
jgi:hypothetical protein